ncbi:carbohydrate-binding protein [Paraglaciecola sp.]|uniref:carbohydrate-binding protein n=1 Tax=Paraglaciecola sp. TaxID=1920173 RepID=UPI0030F4482E
MKKSLLLVFSSILFLLYSSLAYSQSEDIINEYLKFKNNDHGEISLSTGMKLNFDVKSRSAQGFIEVLKIKLDDPLRSELKNYNNAIITLDHENKQLQGFIETGEGHFHFDSSGQSIFLWQKTTQPVFLDTIIHSKQEQQNSLLSDPAISAVGEKDASGRYVIDVFVGFSDQAAAYVGNITATAQTYIESVNLALSNSNITLVYLRLVGVGTSPENPGVITSTLDDGKIWFKDEIERYAPDIVSLVQMPTDADGSAGGWAPVPGDINVIGAPWPSAYRHEVGHNVGGIHCKPANGSGYHYGFSLYQGYGTSQCGNDISYYSSPLIQDSDGNTLGTEHSQDMARVWRARAAEMSQNRIHVVPFPDEPADPSIIQAEDYAVADDTTEGNTGGAYRNDNVDIEDTSDIGGGYNVGWIEAGEWLVYSTNIPTSGEYEISYRVASTNGGGSFQFEQAGGSPVYGVVDVRSTGGWQSWTTVKHKVILTSGQQDLAIAIITGGFNLNWIKIVPVDANPDGVVNIENKWQPSRYINIENGNLNAGNIEANWLSAQWLFEPVAGTDFVRIGNKELSDHYLHIESGQLEATPLAQPTWWSAHWLLEAVDGDKGYFRIKNRWKPDQYIHIENGTLETGSVEPGYWSAQWKLIPVN